jgi:predicted ATPase
MKQEEAVQIIKANLPQLPLLFRYLEALKEGGRKNYSTVKYKAGEIDALQTNEEVIGTYHKPVSRIIHPLSNNNIV